MPPFPSKNIREKSFFFGCQFRSAAYENLPPKAVACISLIVNTALIMGQIKLLFSKTRLMHRSNEFYSTQVPKLWIIIEVNTRKQETNRPYLFSPIHATKTEYALEEKFVVWEFSRAQGGELRKTVATRQVCEHFVRRSGSADEVGSTHQLLRPGETSFVIVSSPV